jgi:hypothetical protein
VAVIGKKARHLSPENALSCVLGYTIGSPPYTFFLLNDDIKFTTTHFFLLNDDMELHRNRHLFI